VESGYIDFGNGFEKSGRNVGKIHKCTKSLLKGQRQLARNPQTPTLGKGE